ncbi:RIC1 domain-containing protein [Pseudozyma hubeiensis]|nr:RIC1 domain-containing protein [Pseudozyma hubeiensis]
MYWPTACAERIHLSPSGLHRPTTFLRFDKDAAQQLPSANTEAGRHDDAEDQIIQIARSRNGMMWAALSTSTISIWSSRPAQVVAALVRTPQSIADYGNNIRIEWRPDGKALLVQTDSNFLLLYNIVYRHQGSSIYSYIPPSGSGARSQSGELLAPNPNALRSSFSPGAGESAAAGDLGLGGLAGEACELRFRLVLRIDAGLRFAASTETHMLVSTTSPPAIQCIRWPNDDADAPTPDFNDPLVRTRTTLTDQLDWFVGETHEGIESSTEQSRVQITYLTYSRPMDVFVWLTSDGRAYVANLDLLATGTSPWTGRAFHGAPKQRRRPSSNATRVVAPDTHPDSTHTHQQDSTPGTTDGKASSDAGISPANGHVDGDSASSGVPNGGDAAKPAVAALPAEQHAISVSINAKFSLIALGLADGTVAVYTYRAPGRTPLHSHTLSVRQALKSTASYLTTGPVRSLSWTSDGYALAVGWDKGMSTWSTYGKLMACTLREDWELASKNFSDAFMFGCRDLFWAPGNTELFILALAKKDAPPLRPNSQLFVLPFSKSAVAGQHSPDNTRFAFYQTDDSLHVYRGADQTDLTAITPESDVWQHIKIPQSYLAANWPVRYAAISADGNLIAVAGRRGLAHYSSTSGRWKLHKSVAQEQSFVVRGGIQWFQHVLIAACDSGGEYQLRLYSRDTDLDSSHLLDLQVLPSPVILTSLFDNSLLVYTADNTFYHFLIDLSQDRIRLRLCGSITFEGIVGEPARVRGMSWMIPESQQRFGDPMDDLAVATIIFLIDGKLVLLRPRKVSGGNRADSSTNPLQEFDEQDVSYTVHGGEDDDDEVAYDMQILSDKIEYYWTHLQGIGTLENSLWGYDGSGIKLWLDALRIPSSDPDESFRTDDDDDEEQDLTPEYKTIESSVSMPLDFYPLCVLLEKGIVLGVESEASLRRSLDFALWRTTTNTHLFLHQVLRNYLEKGLIEEAVFFAASYQDLVYFAHALEILLHAVLEDEADAGLGDALYARRGSGSVLQKERSASSLLADVAEEDDDDHQDAAGRQDEDASDTSGLQNGTHLEPPATTRRGSRSPSPTPRAVLPLVVEFLDHFPEALEVVVRCARKTEVARWAYLFDVVGAPRVLFHKCIQADQLRTAGMYLLVLHNLEPLEVSIAHTIQLLKLAVQKEDWSTCHDLLRFLASIDPSGGALRLAVEEAGILEEGKGGGEGEQQTPPRLLRAASAPISSTPTKLDTMAEEDEDEAEKSILSEPEFSLDTSTIRPALQPGQRSKSATLNLPTRNIPDVVINGQSLTPSLAAMGIGSNNSRRQYAHGIGMSLSRVGLRSSDRIWDKNREDADSPTSPRSVLGSLPRTERMSGERLSREDDVDEGEVEGRIDERV